MTLTIQLPVDDEARLTRKAELAGVDLPTFVAKLLKIEAWRPPIEDILKPVRDAFAESGMNEEQLSDLLVNAKKQMRTDRRSHET